MCDHGDTVMATVVMPPHLSSTGSLKMKDVPVDRCLKPLIDALNYGGALTANSCCGHGDGHGVIHLHDGRVLEIVPERYSTAPRIQELVHQLRTDLEVQSVVAALRKMEKDILTLHRGLVGSGPEGKCSWCGAHFTEDGGRHAGSVECSVINEYMDTGGEEEHEVSFSDLNDDIKDLIAKGEAFDEALSAIRFATFCWDEGDSRQGMEHLQDFLAKYNAEGSL